MTDESPVGLLMKYFVLKPRGTDAYAQASQTAMYAYARAIKEENPVLAYELESWAAREEKGLIG